MPEPAESFALLDKIRFFCVSFTVYQFSSCIKTPWGDAAKFGIVFSTFIVDETSVFVCRYVELFQSYTLPTDGGSAAVRRNLRFSLPNFLGVG